MKFLLQPLYTWYRNLLRNSKYRWVILLGSLLYLVSPIDLMTDIVPFVGWIDDGIVATILIAEGSQLLLEQLKNRRSESASEKAISAS